MNFGSAIGTACLTFVITNIDDAFVLVTFFAESSTSRTLTPLKITLGQYIGFTVIVVVSLIGFAVAMAVPSEPIGFLGLLPILLGVWRLLSLLFAKRNGSAGDESESERLANAKSIIKVASITIMNGGDNIGTYIPLFSQAKGAEIAVYVVVYYILLGVWCLVAFLIMKQKHVLRVVEKFASFIIPFLYLGLGIYIVVKSDCYPWSINRINNQFLGNPGRVIMGIMTGFLLLTIMGVMLVIKLRKRGQNNEEISLGENASGVQEDGDEGHPRATLNSKEHDRSSPEQPRNKDQVRRPSIEAGSRENQSKSDDTRYSQRNSADVEIQGS